MPIHVDKLAAVHPQAELADDVEIGPFCVVGPQAKIGARTKLISGVTILGDVTLGEDNRLFPGTVIGGDPQDLSYRGTKTSVVLGNGNVIREGVTINRGTEKEHGITSLGDNCFIMAGCHVAHDCQLGNRVMLANATLLGGHVHIHDDASLSGGVVVHHFSSIGSFSFTGGLSRVLQDVPPYMLADGNPARPRCVNVVALRRNNFSADTMAALGEAYRLLYRSRVGLEAARDRLQAKQALVPAVQQLLSFLENQHEGCHGRGRDRRRAA